MPLCLRSVPVTWCDKSCTYFRVRVSISLKSPYIVIGREGPLVTTPLANFINPNFLIAADLWSSISCPPAAQHYCCFYLQSWACLVSVYLGMCYGYRKGGNMVKEIKTRTGKRHFVLAFRGYVVNNMFANCFTNVWACLKKSEVRWYRILTEWPSFPLIMFVTVNVALLECSWDPETNGSVDEFSNASANRIIDT